MVLFVVNLRVLPVAWLNVSLSSSPFVLVGKVKPV